ncbi:MAG: M20/M25/M40 family metallo-hydrolase [Spirochaetes bacterium]|nr:M20/M25/M40 family metallo-hydrolase [Spirochaetota bacterium]
MNNMKQIIKGIARSEIFLKVEDHISQHFDSIIEEIKTISAIPSPSYHEDDKAQYIYNKFIELNLDCIKIDNQKNVIGILKGKKDQNFVVCAHIDTVFAKDTELKLRELPNQLFCPSIGDNSTSVAGMLFLIDALQKAGYQPPCNIVFVANSCEEGLGDLKGIKYFLSNSQNVIGMVSIDGTMDSICNEGIGSRRLSVTVQAKGGHSWKDFGNCSAIHAIGCAIAEISKIQVPRNPRTSFNVGTVKGGTTVNSIAESAHMLIDIRSMDGQCLKDTENKIRDIINNTMLLHGTTSNIEVVGDRPSGKLSEDHVIVQSVLESAHYYDKNYVLSASSTDSNIPLSMDIPAVTFGIYQGDGAHTLDEYMEPESIKLGLPILALSLLTIMQQII